MNDPIEDVRFTENHEWLRMLDDGRVEVGISDHAQRALGDLVFVDVPSEGKKFARGDVLAVVESVKAASDVYCPVSGELSEANGQLVEHPDLVNKDPYGAGWLARLHPDVELPALMDATAYARFVESAS